MGAATPAAQAPKNQKIEPAKPAKPLRVLDSSKPIEQNGVWLPSAMLASGNSSICVGGEVANNMNVSGIVSKIWLLPTGIYLVIVANKTDGKTRGIMVTGDGCTSELTGDYDLSEFLL